VVFGVVDVLDWGFWLLFVIFWWGCLFFCGNC